MTTKVPQHLSNQANLKRYKEFIIIDETQLCSPDSRTTMNRILVQGPFNYILRQDIGVGKCPFSLTLFTENDLTQVVQKSHKHTQGVFTNSVDKIFAFFDHLPPCIDIFYGMNVRKKLTFLDHLPTLSCKRSL